MKRDLFLGQQYHTNQFNLETVKFKNSKALGETVLSQGFFHRILWGTIRANLWFALSYTGQARGPAPTVLQSY
ncbi:MAG: hypothetical protein WBM35_02285, partial [Candidatus Electrothrix sp.]